MPLQTEETRPLQDEAREFARLHLDLARAEVRDASSAFRWGLVLILLSAVLWVLGIVGLCLSLFFWLHTRMALPAAALLTAVSCLLVGVSLSLGARKSFSGVSALALPKTREMLQEVARWDSKPHE